MLLLGLHPVEDPAPAGRFHPEDPSVRLAGRDPEGRSYSSHAVFSDPDGNGWVLQEITTRLPGRE